MRELRYGVATLIPFYGYTKVEDKSEGTDWGGGLFLFDCSSTRVAEK